MFDLAVSTNAYLGFELDRALDGIAAAGFRRVELNTSENRAWKYRVNGDMDDRAFAAVTDALKLSGLTAASLCGYGQLALKSRHESFRRLIDVAEAFGCRTVIQTLDAPEDAGETLLTADELVPVLRQFGDVCQAKGIQLCLELHGAYVTGAAMGKLVQKVAHPCVHINYDTANGLYYAGVFPYADLADSLGLVGSVHLKDNRGGQGVWDFPALGDGGIDLKKVLDILSGGTATLVTTEIEYTPAGPRDAAYADETVARSYRYLHSLGAL